MHWCANWPVLELVEQIQFEFDRTYRTEPRLFFLRTRTVEPNSSKKNFELELICRTVRKSKNKVKNTFLNERFNTPFRFCDDESWGSGHSIFIFFLPLSISNGLLLMWKLFFLWLCISFICVTLIYELTFFERTPFRFFFMEEN